MTEYDKLKEKYDILFKETINKNKSILIKSFIEYYGEKYRDLIKERFNRITFVYYFDFEYLKLSKNYLETTLEDKLIYDSISEVINSYNFYKIFSKKKEDVSACFIGTTDDEVLEINQLKNIIKRKMLNSNIECFENSNYKNDIIIIPILFTDECTLIHEINHSITYEKLAYIGIGHSNYTISKRGLTIRTDKEDLMLEDLINEKTTYEILNIFKNNGGDLTSIFFGIPFICPYEENFYLIDEFYNTFKEYIKDSRISENKNLLVSKVGKMEYQTLVSMINKYYKDNIDLIDENKKEALSIINPLIEKMKDNARNNKNCTNKEIELYIKELESAGHTVKILNNLFTMQENI